MTNAMSKNILELANDGLEEKSKCKRIKADANSTGRNLQCGRKEAEGESKQRNQH